MENTDEISRLALALRPIFQRYQIQRAILFGSWATGDASRRSDVDLILVMETDKRFLDRYEGILAELTRVVSAPGVDLLIYTPEELEAMRDRPFIHRALTEGIVIYESEKESLAG